MKNNIPRIMIAGTGSGCGKTTVMCALLSALKLKKRNVMAFKCGPDYIDPMFHSEIIGTPSRNLDIFLLGENTVKYLLANDAEGFDAAIIEGVMGLYDGAGFDTDEASANHISHATGTGVILVLNVKGKGRSIAAEAKGFIEFAPNMIKGFILNTCSSAMYETYRKLLLNETGLPCFGYLPAIQEATISSRHLGLVTAGEIDDIKQRMDVLGKKAAETIDLDMVMAEAEKAAELTYEDIDIPEGSHVRLAVARDNAFCFYYEDNFELLKRAGAELVFFSPITDKSLPEGIDGVIIGGGYPELYIKELSENIAMRDCLKAAFDGGMPIYAECGGFMYLGDTITTGEGTFDTVGAIRGNSSMTDKLVRFGYKTLSANEDNMFCRQGESIKCHEFHYSDTDNYGEGFTAVNRRGKAWHTVVSGKNCYAGYPHLHLWSNPEFAVSFLDKCRIFGEQRRKGGSIK